ncbi:MAG: helix-turn-helix domain-containing protein [Magnetococcales bacterium]|nr:helix-turn-helix domain-containing protein [Magnetococcales bacterium]
MPEIDEKPVELPIAIQVGRILRHTREAKGMTVDEVARQVRLHPNYIHALESGNSENLPGKIFIIGFLRLYAKHLEVINDDLVIEMIDHLVSQKDQLSKSFFPAPASNSRSSPGKLLAFGGLLLLFILFIVYEKFYYLQATDGGNRPLSSRNDEKPVVEHPPDPGRYAYRPPAGSESVVVALPELPVAAGTNVNERDSITIEATAKVWIQVRDRSNRLIYSATMKNGEQYRLPEEGAPHEALFGNAALVRLRVGHAELPPLGKPGEVIRNFKLDRKALLQRLPAAAR